MDSVSYSLVFRLGAVVTNIRPLNENAPLTCENYQQGQGYRVEGNLQLGVVEAEV